MCAPVSVHLSVCACLGMYAFVLPVVDCGNRTGEYRMFASSRKGEG